MGEEKALVLNTFPQSHPCDTSWGIWQGGGCDREGCSVWCYNCCFQYLFCSNRMCLGWKPRTKVIKRLLFLLQTLSSWYLGNGHWKEQERGWETKVQELGEGHEQPLWWETGPMGSSIQKKKNNWWFQAAELRAGREMRQPMREEDTDPCHYPKKETKNRCKSGFSYKMLLGLAAFGTLRKDYLDISCLSRLPQVPGRRGSSPLQSTKYASRSAYCPFVLSPWILSKTLPEKHPFCRCGN